MNPLTLTLLCGLSAAGLTAAVRAVVQEIRPLWLLYKPLSCDLCLSWWGSVASVIAAWEYVPQSSSGAVVVLGSTGVGLLAVKAAVRLSD